MNNTEQLFRCFGSWRRKIIPLLCIGLFHAAAGYAQSASATWQLPSDTTSTAAVVTGNITAPGQRLSTTADTLTTLTIKDYVSGTTADPTAGVQRLWLNNHFWPNETVQQNGRYIQYSVSPLPNNKLTVTSISFNLGELGSSGKFFANVYYSTDSTFASKTQLNSAQLTLSNAAATPSLATVSYSPAFLVESGKTFYVRIYPWYNASSSTPSKFVLISNVVISGTTALAGSPSLLVTPPSLSFNTIKVNTKKDLSFTVSGTLLNPANDTLRITPPDGFGVSTTPGTGYASSLALPYTGASITLDTVFVRFMPSLIQLYSGNISVSGGGSTPQTVAVSGTAVDQSTILGIFVSTTGSDANAGTFAQPYLTLQKAVSVARPGDTIFVRAGTYINSTTITLPQSGTSDNLICLYAYPSDQSRPLFDFSSMSFSGSNRGFNLTGNYWHIKGIEIYKAGDNGMNIAGSNNSIEFCSIHENQDSGVQLGGSASNNRIINCDSYFNYDAPNGGGNADGFSPKQLTGVNNYFYGCRSWQNSDDGWDCFEAVASVTMENCWVFANGYLKDGSDPGAAANGNGFKLGGNYTENNAVVINCLSFYNKSKGFDQNHNKGSMTLLNCAGYGNRGNNYSISEVLNAGKTLTIANCIELGNKRSIGSFAILTTNSWMNPPFAGATTADFVSIDTAGVRGPRKPDGSLPDITFMHLTSNSQLVNRGTDVGLPFIGTAPDLGCFETSVLTGMRDQVNSSVPRTFNLFQNYPNPFNPATQISYQIAKSGLVTLKVFDVLGREVAELVHEVYSPGTFTVEWNAAGMPSGLYFSRCESDNTQQIIKMILMK